MSVSIIPKFCNGNDDAIALVDALYLLADYFDDATDGDKSVMGLRSEQAARLALHAIPGNRFFRKHADELLPLMDVALRNWSIANEFERDGGTQKLSIARIIRSSFVDIFVQIAALCGGLEHARMWGAAIRLHTHHEDQAQYEENLRAQRRASGMEA